MTSLSKTAASVLLICCGALVAASLISCSTPEPTPPPGLSGSVAGYNVVLISIDTLRADRLNSLGYQTRTTSERMDGLVTSGVSFAQASAPRSLTWPSLASVLTGLYPSGHGLIANGYSLADDQPTLPLLLKAAGYQTGAFLSNMCKANHTGWDSFSCAGGVDKKVNDQALAWLSELDTSTPVLLWAHYFGPHPPYYNGGELAKQLDPGYTGELLPKKWALDRVMTEPVPLDQRDVQHLDAIYDAAVIGTDRFVGRLLDGIAEHLDLERTLFVLLADHGEDLYEHNNYLYHACSPYQSSLHVPLAFVAPGHIDGGAQVHQPVELVDVLPTLLDLLGLEQPDCQHGSSLVAYLERPDRGGAGKPAYSQYGEQKIRTFRQANWKLVVNPDEHLPVCMADTAPDLYPIPQVGLYDLETDPGETRDRSAEQPERVGELLDGLRRHEQSLCVPQGGTGVNAIDDDLRKELEAMGYVAN